MKALGPAQYPCHCFDRRADDVVVRVLLGQRDTRRLAMGAQHRGLRVLRIELLHELGPKQPSGPELRDLHEQVHADVEEEAEAWRKGVDVEPGIESSANVFDTVGKCVGQLEVNGRARLLNVIAADRNRIESRHVHARVFDDVGDDPHAWFRRIDVGVTHHELFEDVVLDGARQLTLVNPLFLGRHDVTRHDR